MIASEFVVTGVEVYPNGSLRVIWSLSQSQSALTVGRRVDAQVLDKISDQVLDKISDKTSNSRGAVVRWSQSSRSRLALLLTEATVGFVSFVTLTYPADYSSDGREVKRQLNNVLTAMRARWSGLHYVWFLEFQFRGAPHFHLVLSVVPSEDNRLWLARYWSRLVSRNPADRQKSLMVHSRSRAFEAIRLSDGVKRYALKYALKTYQKRVPDSYQSVGRFWGASRSVKNSIPPPTVLSITESALRERYNLGHLEKIPLVCWDMSQSRV